MASSCRGTQSFVIGIPFLDRCFDASRIQKHHISLREPTRGGWIYHHGAVQAGFGCQYFSFPGKFYDPTLERDEMPLDGLSLSICDQIRTAPR